MEKVINNEDSTQKESLTIKVAYENYQTHVSQLHPKCVTSLSFEEFLTVFILNKP